jgi:hypothetical protein
MQKCVVVVRQLGMPYDKSILFGLFAFFVMREVGSPMPVQVVLRSWDAEALSVHLRHGGPEWCIFMS